MVILFLVLGTLIEIAAFALFAHVDPTIFSAIKLSIPILLLVLFIVIVRRTSPINNPPELQKVRRRRTYPWFEPPR